MVFSILATVLYVVILMLWGLVVSLRVFGAANRLAIAGMTMVFGTVTYLLLVNALGWFVPIQGAAWLALALIAASTLLLAPRVDWREVRMFLIQSLHSKWAWGYATIIVIVGFANARFVGSDPWSWQHFPLAATIVAGNVPVMTPIHPSQALAYHYAPALLAAAFSLVTGWPLAAGFALQPLVGGAGTLLFAAACVRKMTDSKRTAFLAGVLALAGAGLMWVRAPELVHIASVLGGAPVRPALSGLASLFGSPLTTSPLIFLGHRSTATGFPLLYGLLWCIAVFLSGQSRRQQVAVAFTGFIFALGLTLTMELAFVTVSAAVVAATIVFLLSPRTRLTGQRLLIFGSASLFPALLIGLVHGGVLSGIIGGDHHFLFHPSFRVIYNTPGASTMLWSFQFLRDFGVPLFVFPFAFVFAWRRRTGQPLWIFIGLLGLLHFSLPFLFQYTLMPGEMHRAFYAATSTFALLAGVVIERALLSSTSRIAKVAGIGLIAAMLISGIVYLALRLVIPTMRLEPSPVFATMPKPTASQQQLYDWVKAHTTQRDWFYVRNLTIRFDSLPETLENDILTQMRDRILFMMSTGRFTIGPINFWEYDPAWVQLTLDAEEHCADQAFAGLKITYLLVEDADRAAWFKRGCRSQSWVLTYDGGTAGQPYPRVYRHRATPASPAS